MEIISSVDLADILNGWADLPADYREYFAGEYLSPAARSRLLDRQGGAV
jgi:hypothetical protein